MMRFVSLLLIFLLAYGRAFAAGAPIPSGTITVNGNQLTTQAGQNIRASCVDYTGSTPATDMPLMRSAGFNCVRVGWFDKTLSLPTLDAVVSAATTNSMRVLIAHLGNEAAAACGARQQNGVWYDLNGAAPWNTTNNTDGCGTAGTVLYSTFKTNWTNIATHYAGNDTVMGFDLHHEPVVAGVGLTTPVNWGNGNGSDVLAMCQDIGSAVNTADSGALIICPGPVNSGTLFNGTANTTAVADLSLAQTKPVGGGGSGPVPLTKAALLTYLHGLEGNHVLYGQYVDPPGSDDETSWFVTRSGGKHVAVYGDGYWTFGASSINNVNTINANLIPHWNAGGIPYLNELYPSPAGGNFTTPVNPVQVITPGTAQYNALHALYDQEAVGLLALKAAGVFAYFRPFMESRFGTFWWTMAVSGFTDAQWITMWRQHYDYLVNVKGLDNLIWMFIQGFDGDGSGRNNYPGDDVVDAVGEDVYSNNAGDYAFLYNFQTAAHPSKLWVMGEWGSGGPSAGGNIDMNLLNSQIQSTLPRTTMFQAWSCVPSTTTGGWCIGNQSNVPGAVANPFAMVRENMNRPSSTTGGGGGGGSGTATRKPSDIPFTSSSVWNVGVGSGAQWGVGGDSDVAQLRGLNGVVNSALNNFAIPIYFGQQSDPLVTVSANNFTAGANFAIQMHVPTNALPSQDSDAVIAIYDSTQPTVAFSGSNNCTLNNGVNASGGISCGIGNVFNPLGDGVVDTRDFCATTINFVCNFGQLPGVITVFDLGQGAINHAVRVSIASNAARNPGPGGNGSDIFAPCSPIVNMWPNLCTDGNASSSTTGWTGLIYPGTYGIPASTVLTGRGLSQGGLMLATALQKYGANWRDTGGTSSVTFYTMPESNGNALVTQMQNDMHIIVPLLSIMRNQSTPGPDSRGITGQINGGGNYPTPLATVCAVAASTFAGTACPNTVSSVPANKVVLSAHEFPQNVSGRNPDTGSPWITLSNAAYGYLESGNIAPVFIGSTGASLDGSNGALTDDQDWASTAIGYFNGSAINGPSFAACQQSMSTSWHLWGNQASLNPNGVLNSDGTFKSGQQAIWSTLGFTPTCTGGGGAQTTWNPSDNSSTTLTGNNLIATSTAANYVRSTTSKSTGKFCSDFNASTNLTGDWDVGLADATWTLLGSGGLGGDAHGIGFDPLSGPGLGIFFNNVILSFFGTAGDVTGNTATMCVDLDAKLVWFTSQYMRAQGNPWNNSATANPATAVGGISFSGLTCPCFLIYQNFETGSAATLDTLAPFAVGLPSGFSAWDTGVTSTGHPVLINLGANDNLPKAANDDVLVALNLRRSSPQ